MATVAWRVMYRKRLITLIMLLIFFGVSSIAFVFEKALHPTKATLYSYQENFYIGDMQAYDFKRIEWRGMEIFVVKRQKVKNVADEGEYMVFRVYKENRHGDNYYYMPVFRGVWDTFGYCGFSSATYVYQGKVEAGVFYCNYDHSDVLSSDFSGSMVFDLEGKPINFDGVALEKPSYRISNQGYITLGVSPL